MLGNENPAVPQTSQLTKFKYMKHENRLQVQESAKSLKLLSMYTTYFILGKYTFILGTGREKIEQVLSFKYLRCDNT